VSADIIKEISNNFLFIVDFNMPEGIMPDGKFYISKKYKLSS
jgi:hypothetical protein